MQAKMPENRHYGTDGVCSIIHAITPGFVSEAEKTPPVKIRNCNNMIITHVTVSKAHYHYIVAT